MMPLNFRQVDPKLYRSGAPRLKAQVDWLVNNYPKVRKVISLDREAGAVIARLLPPNVQHIQLPINPENPASIQAVGRKLREMNGQIFDTPEGSTLVHCRLGQDRTGFAVAIYDVVKHGASPATAIKKVESLGYGRGVSIPAKTIMNQVIGLPSSQAQEETGETTEGKVTVDISDTDDIVTYLREQGHNQGHSSTVADTSNPVIDQTQAARHSALVMPEGESYPPVNIRARMRILTEIFKKATTKSAVIIVGDPFPGVGKFYSTLKQFLMSIGYGVEVVRNGDLPPVADLWIGYGQGAAALKFAPKSVQQLILKPTLELTPDIMSVIKALDKDDVNEAFLGGGPIGSPTAEELPSGQGSPAIPSVPSLPEIGSRSDYQGSIPGTNYGATGGTPGAGGPGGLVDIDPYGLVQL